MEQTAGHRKDCVRLWQGNRVNETAPKCGSKARFLTEAREIKRARATEFYR